MAIAYTALAQRRAAKKTAAELTHFTPATVIAVGTVAFANRLI